MGRELALIPMLWRGQVAVALGAFLGGVAPLSAQQPLTPDALARVVPSDTSVHQGICPNAGVHDLQRVMVCAMVCLG
jgi:hypothetical protein